MPDSSEIIDGKCLVFLVGAPRSGTTWLQLMLARSKRIAGRAIGGATKSYLEACYEDLKDHGTGTPLSIFEWIDVASSPGECLALLEDTSIEKLRSESEKDAPWDIAGEPQVLYHDGQAAWLAWPRGINR